MYQGLKQQQPVSCGSGRRHVAQIVRLSKQSVHELLVDEKLRLLLLMLLPGYVGLILLHYVLLPLQHHHKLLFVALLMLHQLLKLLLDLHLHLLGLAFSMHPLLLDKLLRLRNSIGEQERLRVQHHKLFVETR